MSLTKKVDAALGPCSLVGITVVYLKQQTPTANVTAERHLKISWFLRVSIDFVTKRNIWTH